MDRLVSEFIEGRPITVFMLNSVTPVGENTTLYELLFWALKKCYDTKYSKSHGFQDNMFNSRALELSRKCFETEGFTGVALQMLGNEVKLYVLVSEFEDDGDNSVASAFMLGLLHGQKLEHTVAVFSGKRLEGMKIL